MATGKWGVAAQMWRSVNRRIWLIEVQISDVLLYLHNSDQTFYLITTIVDEIYRFTILDVLSINKLIPSYIIKIYGLLENHVQS